MLALTIPDDLVQQYRAGKVSSRGLALLLNASVTRVRHALRRQKATLPNSQACRAAFARRVEERNGLPAGTLYEHIAALYQQGHSEATIANRLGIAGRMVKLVLGRVGVETRPLYFRSALFDNGVWQARDDFARRLREARQARNLSQAKLGALVGICQGAVWALEHARNGPHWRTALKLAQALGLSPVDLGLPDVPPEEMRRLARGRPSVRRR